MWKFLVYFSGNVQKKNGKIICQKHHPGEETENGMAVVCKIGHVQLIAIAGTIGDRTPFFWSSVVPSFFDRVLLYYFSLLYADWRLMYWCGQSEKCLYGPHQHTFINSLVTKYLGKGLGLLWMVLLGLLVFFGNGAVSNYVQLISGIGQPGRDSNCSCLLCKLDCQKVLRHCLEWSRLSRF